MKMTSLFSGIGGFDLGFERCGVEVVDQVEIDKNCRELLGRRFPKARILEDVREYGRDQGGAVDVITGGFPCQDLSVAGRRAGLAGERSGLWFEFARIIDEIEPSWVVIENVPGLLSSDRGRDFAVIIRWLAERGYGVSWRVLDSQYFGVPQRRRRVFIVGSFGSGRSAEVLFERESSPWDTAPGREEGEGDARAIGIQPANTGANGRGWQEEVTHTLNGSQLAVAQTAPTIDRDYYKGVNNQMFESQNGDAFVTVGALQARDYKGIGTTIDDKIVWHNKQSAGVRRLTPVECERLQGFPDGWTEGFSDSARYRMLGNAVTVNVAEWIARRIQRNSKK